MKIAYFDTIAGISGDMTLGAFISAGVSFDELQAQVQLLNLKGVELHASHIQKNGIAAVKVEVGVENYEHRKRHLQDVYQILDNSSLSQRVKEDARQIFMEIAKAEAKIHNTSIEKVHFHEVGAVDSIVDIVGVAVCLEIMGIEKIFSSPVKLGSGGVIETEHGKLPLPTPATVEILKDYPIVLTDISYELTTPTGAAIIKAKSSGVLSHEKIKVQSVGYGAGSHQITQVPNLFRVIIGELTDEYAEDELVIVETNIDDMNPEIYPYVVEQLLSVGAHDAYLAPIIMKKGRPGILLSSLVPRTKVDDILHVYFSQTSTLGVRISPVVRRKVQRTYRTVDTTLGRVVMKVILFDGKERSVPEYEECKKIAMEKNLPLMEVYNVLMREGNLC